MTSKSRFVIRAIHPRVARYLKRQEEHTRDDFIEALEHLCEGPFPSDDPVHIAHLKGPLHCSYRYALARGKQGLRIKYDVDVEARDITVFDLGPRGEAYRA
jgi:mRNA-degrading endonuclease RelE of RelBE toxin-antitoxin system